MLLKFTGRSDNSGNANNIFLLTNTETVVTKYEIVLFYILLLQIQRFSVERQRRCLQL